MENSNNAENINITLDLTGMLEFASIGVRRASAFLKLGILQSEAEIPDDISLVGGMTYKFWPTPLPEEAKTNIRSEFRSWIIGSCLKELDAYFSLFLDKAWHMLELLELHGKTLHSSTVLEFDRKFSSNTNAANKAELFAQKTLISIETDYLNSLSRARNSLTHGAGRVRSRDAKDGNNQLSVKWLGYDIVIADGKNELILKNDDFEPYRIQSKDGAKLLLKFVERERRFDIGSKIELTAEDLSEICMFYNQLSAKIHDGLKLIAEQKIQKKP